MVKDINHKTKQFNKKEAVKGNACSIGKKLDISLKKSEASNGTKGKKRLSGNIGKNTFESWIRLESITILSVYEKIPRGDNSAGTDLNFSSSEGTQRF